MMESLRKFLTGPRLFIVIAACALPFVFLGTSSLGSTFQTSFGSINGEEISELDLQVALNNADQRFKNIYGDDFDFNELNESTQLEVVKQELISQKVLLSNARELGLINKDTIRQAKKSIIRNPAFQIDGVFDEGIYEAQVNSAGYTKDSYIHMLTNIMASDLFRIAITSSNFVTNAEIEELSQVLEQTVDINFIKIDSESLREQIVNSDDEIKDFYNNNQIMFFSEEERSFKYLFIESDRYRDLVNIPQDYIQDAYNDYISKLGSSNEIRFSHIMVEKDNYESSDLAYQQILKARDELARGMGFEDVVVAYSEDIVSKDVGGDLDYFDSDVFPEEFGIALNNMSINDTSDIIELEDTFHILKITEFNKTEVNTLEEMQDELLNSLVNSESLALMNDDLELIDEMIFSNESIESISETLSLSVNEVNGKKLSDFKFEIDDSRVKDFVFSPDFKIDSPVIIDLDDSILVLSITSITEPSIQSYDEVVDEANKLLLDNKLIEKRDLLVSQLDIAKEEKTLQSFYQAYDFISEESFVEVKRYSSLLPQEVISEVFKSTPGNSVTINTRSGDVYVVDLIDVNIPSLESIDNLYDQYTNFTEERVATSISSIINDDIFTSAKVNLNNLVF
jgi:peptidyl-prolyl cis-trans isomerase D